MDRRTTIEREERERERRDMLWCYSDYYILLYKVCFSKAFGKAHFSSRFFMLKYIFHIHIASKWAWDAWLAKCPWKVEINWLNFYNDSCQSKRTEITLLALLLCPPRFLYYFEEEEKLHTKKAKYEYTTITLHSSYLCSRFVRYLDFINLTMLSFVRMQINTS